MSVVTLAAASNLSTWQRHVARLVDEVDALEGWSAVLPPHERERLVRQGHFVAYVGELDWTPHEVIGHLRDSALIFSERIRRLQVESEPVMSDFSTTAPERLADYRATGTRQMVAQLQAAQTTLHGAIACVEESQLDRSGWHDVDGRLSLHDVLTFLPGHQQDHGCQLEALTAHHRSKREKVDHHGP